MGSAMQPSPNPTAQSPKPPRSQKASPVWTTHHITIHSSLVGSWPRRSSPPPEKCRRGGEIAGDPATRRRRPPMQERHPPPQACVSPSSLPSFSWFSSSPPLASPASSPGPLPTPGRYRQPPTPSTSAVSSSATSPHERSSL